MLAARSSEVWAVEENVFDRLNGLAALAHYLLWGVFREESLCVFSCHRRVRRDTSSVEIFAEVTVARLPLMGFFGI